MWEGRITGFMICWNDTTNAAGHEIDHPMFEVLGSKALDAQI